MVQSIKKRSLVVSVSWINPNLFLFPFNASQRGKVLPLVFIWVMSHGPRRAVGVIVSLFTRCLACHSATCLFGKISLWVGLLKTCHWERRDHLAARRKIRKLEQNGCISCVSAHIVSQLFSPRRERTTTGRLTRTLKSYIAWHVSSMANLESALAFFVKIPIESPGSAGIFTDDVLSNIIVRQDSPHQRLRVQICAGNGHKILLTDYERPRETCATGSSFNCGLQTFPVLWHISDVSHLPAGIIKYITPGLSLNWSNQSKASNVFSNFKLLISDWTLLNRDNWNG